jgi:hypothetical protein
LLDNVIFFGALVLGAVINTALISLSCMPCDVAAAEHKQQPAPANRPAIRG